MTQAIAASASYHLPLHQGRGPSRGSVTFWLAAAPTPARACAHRAATAGEDDDTAMPNCPVVAHLPRIENVMVFLVRDHRGGINFDKPARTRKCLDNQTGRNWVDFLNVFTHGSINCLPVANIRYVTTALTRWAMLPPASSISWRIFCITL